MGSSNFKWSCFFKHIINHEHRDCAIICYRILATKLKQSGNKFNYLVPFTLYMKIRAFITFFNVLNLIKPKIYFARRDVSVF